MGLAIGNNVPSLSASPTTPLAINGETDTICSLMGGIFVDESEQELEPRSANAPSSELGRAGDAGTELSEVPVVPSQNDMLFSDTILDASTICLMGGIFVEENEPERRPVRAPAASKFRGGDAGLEAPAVPDVPDVHSADLINGGFGSDESGPILKSPGASSMSVPPSILGCLSPQDLGKDVSGLSSRAVRTGSEQSAVPSAGESTGDMKSFESDEIGLALKSFGSSSMPAPSSVLGCCLTQQDSVVHGAVAPQLSPGVLGLARRVATAR